MDKTLMPFDLPSYYTADIKGSKVFFGKTICHEKYRLTVVLSRMAGRPVYLLQLFLNEKLCLRV